MSFPVTLRFQGMIPFANVRLDPAALVPAVGHHIFQIRMWLDTTAHPEPGYCMEDLSMTLWLGQPHGAGAKLGTALPAAPAVIFSNPTGGAYNDSFELALTQRQIVLIEKYREGGDLKLFVELRGRIFSTNNYAHYSPAYERTDCVIPGNHWRAELKKAGAADLFAFQVELPDPEGHEALRRPLEEVIKARDLLLEGHYGPAVTGCRRALEALTDVLQEDADLTKVGAALRDKDKREALSIRERILALRICTTNLASLGAHIGPEGTAFSAHDARFVIAQSALLLSYAANLSYSPKIAPVS